MGHGCGALLWDTLVGHSYGTVYLGQSCRTHTSRLQDERFVVKSPRRAFRKRLPPKVTRQVSKTSVSCETSSKSHASSLQNERFVRDFLKNSHVKVCKTSVLYETSSKSQAETPIGAHTSRSPAKQFRDSSPSKPHPLTRQSQCDSDIHLYRNSQPHDSLRLPRIFRVHTSNAHKVLRLPRNASRFPAPATRIALPRLKTRTKSCACHEK